MPYTKLLTRQLNKYLKEGAPTPPEWRLLLDAVDRSYQHYERDYLLGKQSLEISSQELYQLANEIADREAWLRTILEAAFDGILVINEKNAIEVCNHTAAQYFGFDHLKQLVGKNISILQSSSPEKKIPTTSLFSPELIGLQEFVVKPHKELPSLSLELAISEVTISQKKFKICILRNISKRKQYEKKISLRHQVTRLLLESNSVQEVIPKILSTICLEIGWDIAFFWMNDQRLLRPAFFYSSQGSPALNAFVEKNLKLNLSSNEGIEGVILELKEPYFNCDIAECEHFGRRYEAKFSELKCYIGIPVFFEKKAFGIIELFCQSRDRHCTQDQELMKILHDVGTEIGRFIEHQKVVQVELDLQKQLTLVAREAGMMQVATSVLHNVGNVLNTVNIAASTLQETLALSELHALTKIGQLIQEHKRDLATFITEDAQGKQLPDYLIAIAECWEKERHQSQNEIEILIKNIQHIRNIIIMQQSMSGVGGVKEKVSIPLLLEDLITMHAKEFERYSIHVTNEYEEIPEITLDRGKLLQILVNLIKNAIDSLKTKMDGQKTLAFRSKIKNKRTLCIKVMDNGSGIAHEDLVKIFSYGFTTKKEGHGFGLHHSALLAKEMNGQLNAESPGANRGALFTLTLPVEE